MLESGQIINDIYIRYRSLSARAEPDRCILRGTKICRSRLSLSVYRTITSAG